MDQTVQRSLLRLPAVRARVGLGETKIKQMVKARQFPAPIPLGPRAVAWDSIEVDRWIEDQIAKARRAN